MTERKSGNEAHHEWELTAGKTAMLSPNGDRLVIWDLEAEGGPAMVEMDHGLAGSALSAPGGRYVEQLPEGKVAGPRTGANRLRF